MAGILQAQPRAKRRATQPCCKCGGTNERDPSNGRMRSHTFQGRPCLGGDIPWAEHRRKPAGKLCGMILPRDPFPVRTKVIGYALARGVPKEAIDKAAASSLIDLPEWDWFERIQTAVFLLRQDQWAAAQPQRKEGDLIEVDFQARRRA